MALTVSTHFAIPSLIGRGLTEQQARSILREAKVYGRTIAIAGQKTLPVSYSHGKFTIEAPK